MDASVVFWIIGVLLSLLCCALGVFLFFLVVGLMVFKRRGKKKIKVKQAVQVGAATVTNMFVRSKHGALVEDYDDDDEDSVP